MDKFTDIPFDDIIKFGQKTMLDTSLFSVSWILGRFCNYDCSYCWPYAKSKKPDHQEFEVYTKAIDSIKSQARENGFTDFHFSFSGGEPTAYKNFLKLISYYADDTADYQSIHMTTNLSPGMKWWERWLESTEKLQRKSLTASFHAEFANEKEFGDKCVELIDNGVNITINQVMVPHMFDELYDRLKRFADRGINVTLKPQSDPTASFVVDGYSETQLEIMKTGFPQQIKTDNTYLPLLQIEMEDIKGNKYFIDQAERFNAFGFNKFKNWNCSAGYQSCVIRSNEVKRAYSCHEEPLGTLTDGFTLFKTPSKCVTPTCVSSADSKIPKTKNEN